MVQKKGIEEEGSRAFSAHWSKVAFAKTRQFPPYTARQLPVDLAGKEVKAEEEEMHRLNERMCVLS